MAASASDGAGARRRNAGLPVVAVALAILVASVVPTPTTGGAPAGPFGLVGADAWLHFVGYGVLAAVLARAMATGERALARIAVLAVTATLAYGLAMELLQVPIPTRSFEVVDLVADGVGAAVAVVIWMAWDRAGQDRQTRGRG